LCMSLSFTNKRYGLIYVRSMGEVAVDEIRPQSPPVGVRPWVNPAGSFAKGR
jgi:hypothetical protein